MIIYGYICVLPERSCGWRRQGNRAIWIVTVVLPQGMAHDEAQKTNEREIYLSETLYHKDGKYRPINSVRKVCLARTFFTIVGRSSSTADVHLTKSLTSARSVISMLGAFKSNVG